MSVIINIDHVSKTYRNQVVIDDIQLMIKSGTVFGLLGRNGEGKTTLIKMILGLVQPTRGSINTLSENPLVFTKQTKELIGYAPQIDRLYPWLKAGQFLDYIGSFYQHWNTDLVDRLIKEWKVNVDKPISFLSEGEAQKLSILASVGHEPQLLVLDEPVSSLDPVMRRNFLTMVIELMSDRQCTIFFSTHITSDLERVADQVGILHQGKIKFNGSLDQLKEKYQANLEDIFVELTQ